MIASCSIVSILLSRLSLKEKLRRAHYTFIMVVMAGIAVPGFADAA
jgi:EamA domain-containing membrane protein RarD